MEVFLTALYIENSTIYLTLRRKLFFSLCNGWFIWELRFFIPMWVKNAVLFRNNRWNLLTLFLFWLGRITSSKMFSTMSYINISCIVSKPTIVKMHSVPRSCIIRESYSIEFLNFVSIFIGYILSQYFD